MNDTRFGTWHHFTAAPHRVMFVSGMLQLPLTLVYWAIELTGRHTGLWSPLATQVPGFALHPFLMLYGVFPFFMFGFLMTTYPRWMGGEPIPRHLYLPPWALLSTGILFFYAGLFSDGTLVTIGLLLLLAGWGLALLTLWRVYRTAPAADKHYESWLNAALLAGWAGIAAWLTWWLGGPTWLYRLSLVAGFWLFLIPVLVTVGHRMIPYFSDCVLRPYRRVQPAWSLPLMGLAVAAHVLLTLTGQWVWRFVADLPLAFLALHHLWHWGLPRSLGIRLLAMLHIAWAWFAIGMVLFVIQSLGLLLTGHWWLGHGPQHVLAIGFITSLTIGMATRVTLGHSGRPFDVDRLTWACFLGISATALLRLSAELPLWPPGVANHVNLAAAVLWLACLVPWTLRYMPMLLTPRVDGRAG
ncbi:NnrS family protein [Thioalkalicoccus limnaeus]|uniref:NnrS family protein n=1 Tax=Thioalkalicoccus limnaeus TaxID=120681 RepID=A0ABV4BH95_9GAMM